MSMLSDVIDAATTDTVSLAALLWMTKVLAARMNTPHWLTGLTTNSAAT
jgi:hypothetical protein